MFKTITQPNRAEPTSLFYRNVVIALLTTILIFGMAVDVSAVPGNPSTVFINEIHYENAGGDVGEAVEIAGPEGTSLDGWSIVLYNGSANRSYGTITLSGVIPDQCGGYGTLHFERDSIQNGAPDGLALVNGDGTLIQFLSYESVMTAANGVADGQTSTDIGVSESDSTPVGNSLQLSGVGTTYGDFTWQNASPESFGESNSGQDFTSAGSCSTAVELATFNVTQDDNDTIVTWTTATEIDNAGFNIYGSAAADGPWTKLNANLIPAEGTPATSTSYVFGDSTGAFFFMLEDINIKGNATRYGPASVNGTSYATNMRPAIFIPLIQ